jgi:hypothetical protein
MKSQTYGFGVDPTQTLNHFYVWIPSKEKTTPPTVGAPLAAPAAAGASP